MTPGEVIDIFSHAIYLMMVIIAVILLPGLIVGLLVAMFQAATQINEMTLNFIPRLFVTIGILLVAGPWILTQLLEFTVSLIKEIPFIIG